jgi:hypothetical protein
MDHLCRDYLIFCLKLAGKAFEYFLRGKERKGKEREGCYCGFCLIGGCGSAESVCQRAASPPLG